MREGGECEVTGVMRISIDQDKCESNALCMHSAPLYLEVREDDRLHLLQEFVAEADLSRVEDAVARCPAQAISLVAG